MVIDEQKYRSIARELRKEKKLLAQLMTHCHTRYAYAPMFVCTDSDALLNVFFHPFLCCFLTEEDLAGRLALLSSGDWRLYCVC